MWRAAWVLVGALVATHAFAATPHQRALDLYSESETHYRAGDFAGAASRLREAYALFPEPTLLYNLARALESMNDLPGALDAYTRYLEGDKQLRDWGAIERRIAGLRQQIAERDQLRAQAERSQREADEARRTIQVTTRVEPPSRARWITPWTLVGVGGASLVAGAVLGGVALADHHDAVHAQIQTHAVDLQNDAHRLAIGADVTLAVGGVLAGVGLVWGIVEAKHRSAR